MYSNVCCAYTFERNYVAEIFTCKPNCDLHLSQVSRFTQLQVSSLVLSNAPSGRAASRHVLAISDVSDLSLLFALWTSSRDMPLPPNAPLA